MCQELKDCVTFVTPLRWQTNFCISWNTRMAYSLAMIGWPYMKQQSQLILDMSRQVININYYAILSRSFSSDHYQFRLEPHISLGERRSRNRMIVGFMTSCAISAYHHLKLCIQIPLMARCTRNNIMWYSLSVTCDMSVVFSSTLVSYANITDHRDIT